MFGEMLQIINIIIYCPFFIGNDLPFTDFKENTDKQVNIMR